MGRLLGLRDFMRCGRSSSRASPMGDRSLCATYHILEGAYKPESENRHLAPFSTSRRSSNPCQTAGLPDCCDKRQPSVRTRLAIDLHQLIEIFF
ncbi:hypothetical protein [Microcoleus sp. N3A4]|uniref:hypothetical protein n=1 Tax=Microcoleus sp. N3A4 TaxID=3055379 RepID=UPI002FCED265